MLPSNDHHSRSRGQIPEAISRRRVGGRPAAPVAETVSKRLVDARRAAPVACGHLMKRGETRSGPIHDLVLVGGGHTHIQVLKSWAMSPVAGTRLTVVVDRPVAIYSGMVPGFVAGQYRRDELAIDVWPLARRAGARVIAARAVGIDARERRIALEDRPPVRYDTASFDVGSTVGGLDLPGVREHALATRPIAHFVAHLEALISRLRARSRPAVVVVGAGAAG